MPYSSISETEFNDRYQLLAAYIQANEAKLNANNLLQIRQGGLSNFLPDGDDLKGKNIFVVNQTNRKSFLHLAAAEENLSLITFLKETGHEIDRQDAQHKTPLYDACDELKLRSVNALLGYNADPNLGNGHLKVKVGNQEYTGETVPLVAAIESTAIVTRAELSAATGQDFSQLTTEQATEQARDKITKSLIAKRPNGGNGADVNLQTGQENFSALHRSIINLQISTVKVFTDFKDTDFRLVDRDGQTALHMVVDYRDVVEKQKESAQMLKEKQITELIIPHLEAINVKDKNGNTPLHTAVINSNADVVEAIYRHDYLFPELKLLSIKNNAGNTAIHEAILESKRGPKVLAILLRVATPDDLAITNNQGETAQQLASRLTLVAEQEAAPAVRSMGDLVDEVDAAADKLENSFAGSDEIEEVSAPQEIKQLQEAIDALDKRLDRDRATKHLSADLEGLSLDAGEHAQDASVSLTDAKDLISRARQLVTDTKNEFFHENYIKSLKSVHQLEYTAWKNDLLNNASPFPNFNDIDTQSAAYQTDITQANTFRDLGNGFLNVNDNVNARTSIELAIPIYTRLKNDFELERCYQSLAKTYIGDDDAVITRYETENQNKLHSSDNQEKLQGHLALGALYKELREQKYTSASFSSDDLQTHESYHYYQAYKLTQGDLDAHAPVVLQHEMGIANNAKLGTYNIQQCVAIIAFDPISKKVVLSHFDRFSGPLSFMEQIVNEFPNPQHKIELYLSGGRDRVSTVSTTSTTKISDNNIDQVLKQIYAEQERFEIKAAYVGDNPSPPAIVFDVQAQQLVHATPDLPDSSLPSREVNFYLQKNKADYLRPLNRVDFTQSVVARTILFTEPAYAVQKLEIHTKVVFFNPRSDQTTAWNHQELYPFITVQNELIGATPNFQQGLLKKALLDRYQGASLPSNLPCIASRRRRDAGLCVLDSEHLIEELAKLPEAKQSEVLDHVATRRVGGTKQEEVATLVRNQKITHHLEKVRGFSAGFMDGLFTEDAIAAALFKGDRYPAFQLGELKILGRLLENLAAKMEAEGLEWVAAGKALRGNFLRAGGAFASRSTSLIMAGVDLANQVSAFEKDSNNTVALVNIVNDGVQITNDGLQIGVKIAELSSERIALVRISEFTGPIGEAVVVIAMVGVKVFDDIEEVANEDHLFHLTDKQKGIEGVRIFFGMRPIFQKELDEISDYDTGILPNQFEFLKNHTDIKDVIFSAIEKTGEKYSCKRTRTFQKGCTSIYTPTFSEIQDSSVDFQDKLIGFKLSRETLTAPLGSEFLCLPTGSAEHGIDLPEGGAYACDGALGLTNINSTGNAAFYNLGDGEDHVAGFANRSNIFMVNDGAKDYAGGDLEDSFIIDAKKVVTAVNKEGGIGGLDGGPGSDSLFLQRFQPEAECIDVYLGDRGYLQYGNETSILDLNNIEKLFGGIFPLAVTAGCDTEEIHLAGGPTLKNLDTLFISKNSSCAYDLRMYLQPHVRVINEAEVGNFTYYILPGKGNVAVNLTRTEDNANTKQLKQQFVFNALISDVSSISFSTSDDEQSQAIKLHFIDHRMRTLSRKTDKISFSQPNATANVSIAYQFKSDSYKAPFVLPMQLQTNRTRELLKKHLVNPAADSFNVTLTQPHEIRHALLNLINDESVEDFTFELNAHLSNDTSFQFIDNAELIIGKKNNYLFKKNLNQSVSEIMDRYAPIARRLNLICILTTQDNEQIVIGHNGKVAMNNNPLVRTHHNWNGAEGLSVVKSGMESLVQLGSRLPIKEVVLHRPVGKHIGSLDLRELNAQVRAINATTKIRFEKPNKRNKLGKNDLKLMVGMQTEWTPAKKAIPIVEILLKDVQNHWHKKYLHIYLNGLQAHRIAGRHSHLHLKPEPLEFGPQHELAIIGIKDVAENTDIIIPHAYQPGAFYRDKENLVWTNTLSNRSDEPFTLILPNFYREPNLKTLSLQFMDKKIVLKNKFAQLNATKDFEEASNTRLASLRAASLAILSSQPLVSHTSHQAANVSEIEVNPDQEHYLDNDINDINATSIEDHTEDYSNEETNEIEIGLSRRRRAAEDIEQRSISSAAARQSGILQTMVNTVKSSMSTIFSNNAQRNSRDKIFEIANDFYDKQDQMKAPVRKKVAKQSKKVSVETIQKPVNNSAKHIVPTGKPVKNAVLSNQLHKKADRVQTSNNIAKASPFFCGKQRQIQPTFAPQNVRSNNQTFYVNPSSIKNTLSGANLVKGLGNKPENFSRSQSLAQARLADNQYRHQQHSRQQTGKSGISKVTAVGDMQGLLLLGHCMFISKPQTSLNPKVVRFHQQEERRICKQQGPQKLYIPK